MKSYGFDGSVAFRPTPKLTLLALGSYIKAELKDDVEIGTTRPAARCRRA